MSTPMPNIPQPAPSPAPRKPRWPWYVGVTVLGLVIIGSCSANAGVPTTYSSTALPPTVVAPAVPAGPVTSISEGTFEVGTGAGQVPPGVYHTTGPARSGVPLCYWERDKDTSGDIDSIIANDPGNGPTTVTIASTDGAFKTRGCESWTKVR